MSSGVAFEDMEETKRGRDGEDIAIDFLERNGWGCVNTSRASGDGPAMLTSITDNTIIPDLLTSRDGVSRWVEVKAKDPYDPSEKGINDVPQQGIEIRQWEDYIKVQDLTGLDTWVFIYEPELETLCIRSVRWMAENVYREVTHKYDPMYYWRREDFRIVDPYKTPEDGAFGDEKMRGWIR